ncbi:MAG: gliding motility-associated C-terminal domain-containing protein, partial [Bacteroidetes bacterium]|nr:gliding motility-associated C-terminal domain-containing protein [Bacteroidota bacterium]
TYYNGITHLPLTDVEYNENGYIVRIIRPYTPNPVPALFWDDTNIPFGSASPDGGCTNPAGCHNFYNFFGDSCTINTWWYASENVHDTLDFIFHQVLVDASLYTPYGADNDTAICSQTGYFQLNGGVINAPSAYWSGGNGSFDPGISDLNAVYYFSQDELDNCQATLYLNTSGPSGCPGYMDKITITVEQPPVVNAGNDNTLCIYNSGIALNGSLQGVQNGIWSGGSGEFVPGPGYMNSVYYPSETELQNGIVTLTLTSEALVCSDTSDDVTYYLVFISVDTANTDISCYGLNDGYISITPGGNTGGYDIVWEDGDSVYSISGLSAGNYCFTVTENMGCTAEDCITISEPSLLEMNLNKRDVSCNGIDFGWAESLPYGGTPGYAYNWSNGSTGNLTVNLVQGTYRITVTDANGCTAFEEILIGLISNPSVSFTSSNISGCQPLVITFNETAGEPGCHYLWLFSEDNGLTYSATEQKPTYIFDYDGVYNVTLTVTSDEGCDSSMTVQEMITVFKKPEAAFIADPYVVNILEPGIQFGNTSSENSDYFKWNFGDNTFSYVGNPYHYFDATGTYMVELIATTTENCSDTARHTIEVREANTMYVPTAFTPGIDNTNDIFAPKGTGILSEGYHLYIYDRWGAVIFESGVIENGWNGRNGRGRLLPPGVYTWRIIYKDSENRKHVLSGPVTLIR